MNWVEVAWPLVASMSLVFGLVHLLVWWSHDRERVHLALAIAAFSLATLTVLERLALFSPSAMQTAAVIRWMHVPVVFMVMALVYTVHATFGFGAPWLAAATIGLRLLAVVLNFSTGVNLNFLSIDHIQWSTWWGVAVADPIGPPNPALLVALLSNLFLMAFLVHTLLRGLRLQPVRRRALVVVCGAGLLLTTVLIGATLSWALHVPRLPLTLPSVLVLLLAIGWQLGGEFVRWNRLEGLLNQSESRRLHAERELDLAALTSGLGLWHWDVAGHTFTQNSNNRNLLGEAAPDGAEGSNIQMETSAVGDAAAVLFAQVDTAQRAQVRARFDEAIRQPNYELEYQVCDTEGERHWICLRGSAEHDAEGVPTMVRGLTQDVSGLRSEEDQLRAVLDASPTALLLVDQRGEIRYANEQGAVIFGYERVAMSGVRAERLLPSAFPGSHARTRRTEDRRAFRRSRAHTSELVARARCGREFLVEVVLNPLQWNGTEHVVAAVSDLTERRREEQEMAFERESMAHMSRVTLIGEISGSLAHELNQPLAAILSNAQAAQRMLRRDPADIADIREILDDIVENDRRAGEVISRLRGLLKKECRSFVPLDVSELVHESIRIIRNDLINRGVEYRLDLAAPISRVQGDPVQLQQVLLNLIINACDAMSASNPRVLTVRTHPPRQSYIRVEVCDTGPGIPEEMLDAIFTPFQTSKPNGMGMGLAICRTLLRAHGSRIWAANRSSGGAAFYFELPVLE